MSIAAAQYAKFAEQVALEGFVFSFAEPAGFLVFKIDGHDVVPVWSSATRLQRIQKEHPQYQRYETTKMPLAEFLAWLPELEEEKVRLGVNWSGKALTGYDVEPQQVRAMIEYQLSKARKVVKGPWSSPKDA
jgi:hypothetical protein